MFSALRAARVCTSPMGLVFASICARSPARAITMKHPPVWGQVGTGGEEFSRRWRGSAATSRVSAASVTGTGSRTTHADPFGDWRNRAGIRGSAGQLGAHNPENAVNVIYTAGLRSDTDAMTTTTTTIATTVPLLPPGIVSPSLIFETYSLFYRSRKDVRQLKDSFDLLCGRMARRCDGSWWLRRPAMASAIRVGGSSEVKMVSHVHGIAGTPDIVLYRRSTKDAFSHAHKRPRSRCDIPRAVYYVRYTRRFREAISG